MASSLVWFRNDLRIHDHEPLVQAIQSGLPIVAYYCFDRRQFQQTKYGFVKTGTHRFRFLRESVKDLREQLRSLGIPLLIRVGHTEQELAEIVQHCDVRHIFYYRELGSEESAVERAIQVSSPQCQYHGDYGHNMIQLTDLPFAIEKLPPVFSQFRSRVEKRLHISPLVDLPSYSQSFVVPANIALGDVPTEQQLSLPNIEGSPVLRGGSEAGRARLQHYLFDTQAIATYKQTRNGMLRFDDSSKLSPYLALGCLSARQVYWEIKRYEQQYGANDSTYWLFFELLWRDYFWFVHAKYGDLIFHRGGLSKVSMNWDYDEQHLQAWLHGQTGYPLVDANMVELRATGWMSNRGRQNVASFLTKNLGIDWRIGAAWFESCLLDYDVASNYGNWCYAASVGNDPREFRVFNVVKQGHDYDAQGEYAKRWLPALQHVPGTKVYDVHTLTAEQQAQYKVRLGIDYPYPMVNQFDAAEKQRRKRLEI